MIAVSSGTLFTFKGRSPLADFSKIAWTDHSWNPWWGCNKVSAECWHCYIRKIMRRAGREPFQGPIRTKTWKDPPRWNRLAAKQGKRFKVFTCSMSDFFHDGADQWRQAAWDIMRDCEPLDWLVLTKRPERIADQLPTDWNRGYPNVWLGMTCGENDSLWRLDILKSIPAAIRFISAEPLLEAIDFTPYLDGSFHWIISGCEQAAVGKRRKMEIDWVRDIHRQCQQANIAHFFKQRYDGARFTCDGVLDGKVCHAWPNALLHQATEKLHSA